MSPGPGIPGPGRWAPVPGGTHRRPGRPARAWPDSPRRERKIVRRRVAGAIFGGGAVGVVVLALLAAALVWTLPAKVLADVLPGLPIGTPPQSSLDAARIMGYDLEFEPNVRADMAWTFPVDAQAYRANACDADESCTPLARVFTDARLTRQIDADVGLVEPDRYRVAAALADVFAEPPCVVDESGRCQRAADPDQADQVARQGKWTVGEAYYLARYFDEDGGRLPRLQVTMFTVNEPRLAAPGATTSVASDGSINFTWPAVPEATGYTVLSVVRGVPTYTDGGGETGVVDYRVVGRTAGTSLNSLAASGEGEYLARALTDASVLATGAQNVAIDVAGQAGALTTQDELVAKAKEPPEAYDPSDNGLPQVTYAVLATNAAATSPLIEVGAATLLPRVPVALAKHTNAGLGRDVGCDGSLSLAQCLARFTMMTVTMADGRMVDRPAQFAVLPEAGKCTPPGAKAKSCWRLRAVAYGTTLVASWRMDVPGNGPSSEDKKAVESRNKKNFATWQKVAGGAGEYRALDAAPVAAVTYVETAPTVAPAVSSPVNGSTELTRFIGAHLGAGNTEIEIPVLLLPGAAKTVEDPLYEALEQNPMALMPSVWWSVSSGEESVTLNITAGVTAKQLASKRTKVAEKVKKVAAAIVTPNMSDRGKALAINRWLSRNATYDYAAYNAAKKLGSKYTVKEWEAYIKKHVDSGTAAGVLLNGKGVCASYAAAFKALADVTGLRSVVVTGTADGESHAWNKVFMDGRWQLVDPTWNDNYAESGGSVTRFFGLRDGADNHRQDKDWMTDAFVPYYAAK